LTAHAQASAGIGDRRRGRAAALSWKPVIDQVYHVKHVIVVGERKPRCKCNYLFLNDILSTLILLRRPSTSAAPMWVPS
jgi:hypothetical protein